MSRGNVSDYKFEFSYQRNQLQDRILFKANLDKLIKEYDCSCRINPLKKLFQFLIFLAVLLISFIRHNSLSKRSLNDRNKIRIHLLTVAIDQSFVGKFHINFVQIDNIWPFIAANYIVINIVILFIITINIIIIIIMFIIIIFIIIMFIIIIIISYII